MTLSTPSSVMKKLSGLMSRWMTDFLFQAIALVDDGARFQGHAGKTDLRRDPPGQFRLDQGGHGRGGRHRRNRHRRRCSAGRGQKRVRVGHGHRRRSAAAGLP